MSDYANPGVLVSTDWIAGHLEDPGVALVEVDVDTTLYDTQHIPGAGRCRGAVRRDILSQRPHERAASGRHPRFHP